MSSVVIHFPDGSREFRFPEEPLEVGSFVWHAGERYRVIHVANEDGRSAVTVEPDTEDMGDLLSSERGGILLTPLD